MSWRILVMVLLLLAAGCSGVSSGEAESIAQAFVQDRVKFFSREGNATADLPEYGIDAINSYQEQGEWVVVVHVSSEQGDDIKQNDLVVKVDFSGEVVEFNGVRLDS